ncbi:MAG TPA: hypothetical protein V6D03_12675, partial [Candidatus Caenarcaniphilales bacterium]
PEQPIEVGFDHPIALANCRFQPLAIEDAHVASVVVQDAILLEPIRRHYSIDLLRESVEDV